MSIAIVHFQILAGTPDEDAGRIGRRATAGHSTKAVKKLRAKFRRGKGGKKNASWGKKIGKTDVSEKPVDALDLGKTGYLKRAETLKNPRERGKATEKRNGEDGLRFVAAPHGKRSREGEGKSVKEEMAVIRLPMEARS